MQRTRVVTHGVLIAVSLAVCAAAHAARGDVKFQCAALESRYTGLNGTDHRTWVIRNKCADRAIVATVRYDNLNPNISIQPIFKEYRVPAGAEVPGEVARYFSTNARVNVSASLVGEVIEK